MHRGKYDVLIVGAGHGGAQAAIALRQLNFGGSIGLMGDESVLPYERPPLSKEYLAGDKPFERMQLRPENFWRERNIDLLLGYRVVAVDPQAHVVHTENGHIWEYDKLVWAGGGRARTLSCDGATYNGIYTIRNREDTDKLIGALPDAANIVVIGGGYIGLEAAASLRKLGKQVTVVEAQDRVLARVTGPILSDFYQREHAEHGVDFRLGCGVRCIEGVNGKVNAVRLTDDSVLTADVVIVGIGIEPSVEPLKTAGASGTSGVDIDARGRTSLPDIFALGDCAAHENLYADGQRIRLESVQNANDQATVVAKEIMGQGQDYCALPWFWSNQYDLRLQTIGLSTGYDQCELRGDIANRKFSLIYLKQGRVIALDCVNAPIDFAHGRALILARATPDRAALADPQLPLHRCLH